jgi:hypothetical protein
MGKGLGGFALRSAESEPPQESTARQGSPGDDWELPPPTREEGGKHAQPPRLIDGAHRYQAKKEKKAATILTLMVECDDAEAEAMEIAANLNLATAVGGTSSSVIRFGLMLVRCGSHRASPPQRYSPCRRSRDGKFSQQIG